MDYISLLFSVDQINELLEFPPAPFQQPVIQHSDLLVVSPMQSTGLTKPVSSRKRKVSIAFDDVDNKAMNYKKKIQHRDVERQRRRELASLHQSLRSLLPIECLKGKQSVADHIHETVGYIRQLQKKIENLSEEREKSKQLLNLSSFSVTKQCSPSCSQTSITVKTSRTGVEVSVNTALRGGLNLSEAITILKTEGLSISSCISTKVNERLLHIIEAEVNEGRSINSTELQQQMSDFCNRNCQTSKT